MEYEFGTFYEDQVGGVYLVIQLEINGFQAFVDLFNGKVWDEAFLRESGVLPLRPLLGLDMDVAQYIKSTY